MQSLKDILKNGKWKQLKKSDWLALALVGVLLLIVTMPTKSSGTDAGEGVGTETDGAAQNVSEQADNAEYEKQLEQRLEQILERVEGVGEVKVMITVSDTGESVVEKDSSRVTTTTSEVDSSGGSRSVTESDTSTSTVYVENGNEKYPYVQKEVLPAVEGVVVVAEGGDSATVVSEITEAVSALFPVEAHKIKVVPMSRANQE